MYFEVELQKVYGVGWQNSHFANTGWYNIEG
jgi:hypothetical protein